VLPGNVDFHYTNLAEGVTEQRLETDVYVPLA
ncbi:putative transcriptional regulator ygiV, partial [human gut metagenome]